MQSPRNSPTNKAERRRARWRVLSSTLRKISQVLFTFYYVISISFRLAFRVNVTFSREFVAVLLADYFVDVFFWGNVIINYFERMNSRERVLPGQLDRGFSSRSMSGEGGVQMRSRMATMTNMEMRNSKSSQKVAPDNESDNTNDKSTTNDDEESFRRHNAGRKLLKSLSSVSDYDMFEEEGDEDSNAEEDLLTNFQKNQEGQEMLMSLKKAKTTFEKSHILYDVLEFIMLCPFEVFGYLVDHKFYFLLRAFRLVRLIYIPRYFREISRILVDTELMIAASARRVLFLTTFMVMFAHVGACSFYALGLHLLDNGVSDVWLTYDGIVTMDEEAGDGSYYFNEPLGYRYIRVLYWAVVTSQTVGFGDVRPRSIQETSFCLAFFYISHFLCAQLAIGNLLLLFDVYDSARTQYNERIEHLEKYSQFRKLPPDLKDRIKCFYHHQWKALQGLDESQLIKELPSNIIIKVKQATIRKYLLKVPMFKRLKMVVMNALADDVKLIIYSPSDVIVPIESKSTGMFIISRGEAFISSKKSNHVTQRITHIMKGKINVDDTNYGHVDRDDEEEAENDAIHSTKNKDSGLSQSLKQGDFFGVQGVKKKYQHTVALIAGNTVCEVLFLSRVRFQRTISLYLSQEEAKQYQTEKKYSNPPGTGNLGSEISPHSIEERDRRMSGNPKTLSHVRASAILNLESNTVSGFVLRLKADGDIRTIWDLLIFSGIAFYSISIPLDLSYSFKHNLFSEHMALFLVGFFVDFIFLVDFLSRMFLFPTYKRSVLMTSSQQIYSVYKSDNPFIIEFLSVFPFDIIALLNPSLLPVLRIFKIYHMSRFKDYAAIAEKAMAKYLHYTLSFSTSRFIRLQIGLFELCHWAACLWQVIAEISTHTLNYDINWKIQDRDTDYLSIKYSDTMDNFTAYIRSLYWAINALSTSGVADMPSTNVTEMIFVCFALLLGCQSINAVLGSIASMMGNINKTKSDFSNKMEVLSNYMNFKRVPVRLQLKIQFFFEYNFQRTSGVDEMKLLADLPQPLREDVVAYIVGSVIIGIPFFRHCSEPMLEMILGLLTRRCFLNNDDVVVAGDFGKEFFIIESGSIFVTSKDKVTVYAKLRNGNYIGESCLLKVAERTASAHARDYSETYVLKKSDFENVVDVFPEDGELVKRKINDLLTARSLQNKVVDKKKSRRSLMTTFVRMESIHSLDTSDLSMWDTFLEEFSYVNKLWQCLLLFILLYNIFMIPLRLAFTKDSFALNYIIDYAFDIILWIDMYLNAYKFRRIVGGKKIKYKRDIWRNYKTTELKYDLLARFPYDLLALAFFGDLTPVSPWFVLAFLRLPKMFLLFKGSIFLNAAEYVIENAKISFFGLRMLQVLVSCLLVGHCLGCGLYVFQKAHYGESCVNEEGAFYGDACKYRDTWIQFLIYTRKLPSDGGSALSRYIACINWAIPTMVLYTVGDVYPMNINETAFIFAAMFIGIPINAMIVGTIIALITQVDDQSADILMKSDTLRESLIENNANDVLVESVSQYIKFLVSEKGKLLRKEEEIFEELPHTLQVMLSSHLKEKFLQNCPFFNYIPEDAIRNLCMTMVQRIYYIGDYVITHGDIGHEMFFIESGECEVVSWDRRTVLAKIQAGAFMGETSFFGLSDHGNKYMNLENIRSTTISVCYVLKKRYFDSELVHFSDGIDAEKREENLKALRTSHCKRNAAMMKNFKTMENNKSKLRRVLGPLTSHEQSNPWLEFIRPSGNFRFAVDVVGYICMLYYAVVIPFEIAFLYKDISTYAVILTIDVVVDGICILELLLRLLVFPYANEEHKSYEMKSSELYQTTLETVIDNCASLPLELLVLTPFVDNDIIFFLRAVHMLRLSKLFIRTKQMEEYMLHIGITLHFTTLGIIRGVLLYVLGNHWMACLAFSLHRYVERGFRNSWVVVDGYATYDEETHKHNICSKELLECYQRSIYFIGTVLTSVGYGDVAPITSNEMIFQIWLAIVGACMGAYICGQMTSYLKLGDRTGDMAFKEKLKSVEHYCSYRNLAPDLRLTLLANYHIMWNKERRVGAKKSSFLHELSTGLMGDVALTLNKDIIEAVPLFQACRKTLHARLALVLKPQITLPETSVYTAGDGGSNLFLILSGQVNVTLSRGDKKMSTIESAAKSILQDKLIYLRHIHEAGHHFGECALCSTMGTRRDNAVALQLTESYAIDKRDLWYAVFPRMPTPEQYLFLKSIFSTVGGYMYIRKSKMISTNVTHITNRYFQSLTHLMKLVIEDITGTGEGISSVQSPTHQSQTMNNDHEGKEGDDVDDCDNVVIRHTVSTMSVEESRRGSIESYF